MADSPIIGTPKMPGEVSGASAPRGRGRPVAADPIQKNTIGLYGSDWEWLKLWHPGSSSEQARELLTRARKFWPDGPHRAGAAAGATARPGGVRDLRKQLRAERERAEKFAARLRALGEDV